MCKPVLTKCDFYKRFSAGEFGNRGPIWKTPEELLDANYRGKVHLRNKTVGGATHYNLEVSAAIEQWKTQSKLQDFICAGMAPHHCNLIQGEVALLPEITLRYSSAPDVPMREALALGEKHQSGIIALLTLKYYLCPNSYDWLHVLLERYPGHVVEFSSFSCNWGTLPHYNTVFWEIRAY